MNNQMPRTYCWPEHWIEAAMRAGFAHYKGNGQWEFINNKLRDMLAEFAISIEENAENEERERCAKVAELEDVAATDDPVGVQECIAASVRAGQRCAKVCDYMPLLGTPLAIRFDALSEAQAIKNHSQSLDKLRDRQGVGLDEAVALKERRKWHSMSTIDALRALAGERS